MKTDQLSNLLTDRALIMSHFESIAEQLTSGELRGHEAYLLDRGEQAFLAELATQAYEMRFSGDGALSYLSSFFAGGQFALKIATAYPQTLFCMYHYLRKMAESLPTVVDSVDVRLTISDSMNSIFAKLLNKTGINNKQLENAVFIAGMHNRLTQIVSCLVERMGPQNSLVSGATFKLSNHQLTEAFTIITTLAIYAENYNRDVPYDHGRLFQEAMVGIGEQLLLHRAADVTVGSWEKKHRWLRNSFAKTRAEGYIDEHGARLNLITSRCTGGSLGAFYTIVHSDKLWQGYLGNTLTAHEMQACEAMRLVGTFVSAEGKILPLLANERHFWEDGPTTLSWKCELLEALTFKLGIWQQGRLEEAAAAIFELMAG